LPLRPLVIELREWSRIYDELKQEQNRLTNRMRAQLWRYYPQAIELSEDLAAAWLPSRQAGLLPRGYRPAIALYNR
jgi:hypothetical protein